MGDTMPNGVDRNFVRFIGCLSGFRAKFNKWPTKIRLDPSFITEFKEVMTTEDYQKMTKKISIIPDNSNPWDGLYIAEDDEGNTYDLIKYGHPSDDVDALGWLGIKWPDYGPD